MTTVGNLLFWAQKIRKIPKEFQKILKNSRMLSKPTKLMTTVGKYILCAQKFRKAPKKFQKILPIIFDHCISGKKLLCYQKLLKFLKRF
jgi:hypothetical protein